MMTAELRKRTTFFLSIFVFEKVVATSLSYFGYRVSNTLRIGKTSQFSKPSSI